MKEKERKWKIRLRLWSDNHNQVRVTTLVTKPVTQPTAEELTVLNFAEACLEAHGDDVEMTKAFAEGRTRWFRRFTLTGAELSRRLKTMMEAAGFDD